MKKGNTFQMRKFIDEYCENVASSFRIRWSGLKIDLYNQYVHESLGALLARQATLSIEFARAPTTWNGHVAPLFLRCMVDAYISLAWILDDPQERSRVYVEYGLGQEKLYISYLEDGIGENVDSQDKAGVEEIIAARRAWLENQLAMWATDVNIGSWSGMSTRDMAKTIGRESLYKFAYMPFSGCAHNMWQHVGVYNMKPCRNPLHKYHLVPDMREADIHPDFFYRSAKYVSMAYELCDEKLGTKCDAPLPVDFLVARFGVSEEEGVDDQDRS
jgi:hypothetical protein